MLPVISAVINPRTADNKAVQAYIMTTEFEEIVEVLGIRSDWVLVNVPCGHPKEGVQYIVPSTIVDFKIPFWAYQFSSYEEYENSLEV